MKALRITLTDKEHAALSRFLTQDERATPSSVLGKLLLAHAPEGTLARLAREQAAMKPQ